ncbi:MULTISPECIES: DUF6415 family natural product biosynthesis protein [Streptomyces]|uniref:DUF6415 family natural product biosynthesis protein n=1 Tax=Streptomyces TaxID=1883 RepID=UPI00115FB96F|nr:DUF6415 family natural product biosynthesis protein [Streptomyces melanosporofaciens]
MDALERILAAFRNWDPLDWDAILEDLADVLGQEAPEHEELVGLADRLHSTLIRLLSIASAGHADEKDQEAVVLIERARTLDTEDFPDDRWKALGYVRRLGWTINELMERLSRTGHIDAVS